MKKGYEPVKRLELQSPSNAASTPFSPTAGPPGIELKLLENKTRADSHVEFTSPQAPSPDNVTNTEVSDVVLSIDLNKDGRDGLAQEATAQMTPVRVREVASGEEQDITDVFHIFRSNVNPVFLLCSAIVFADCVLAAVQVAAESNLSHLLIQSDETKWFVAMYRAPHNVSSVELILESNTPFDLTKMEFSCPSTCLCLLLIC